MREEREERERGGERVRGREREREGERERGGETVMFASLVRLQWKQFRQTSNK